MREELDKRQVGPAYSASSSHDNTSKHLYPGFSAGSLGIHVHELSQFVNWPTKNVFGTHADTLMRTGSCHIHNTSHRFCAVRNRQVSWRAGFGHIP